MIKISRNKARYEKGQIFPFLIAVLVVILIAIMITVNLGQVGMLKVDTSNAADAGALAAASTLSGYLLGFGLKSDFMEAHMITTEIWAVINFLVHCGDGPYGWIVGLVLALITHIAGMIKNFIEYFIALTEGKMAWGQAKKTAFQYAFQNAGVDEVRPTFRQFLEGVYGISGDEINDVSPADMAHYYNVYSIGDDPNNAGLRSLIKQYTQTGFNKYMEEARYWRWGKIAPWEGTFPPRVTSGYGWNDDGTNVCTGSNDCRVNEGEAYKNYENWVEVEIMGNIMYPLDIYSPLAELFEAARDRILDAIEDADMWGWVEDIADFVVNLIFGITAGSTQFTFPAGLEMSPIVPNTRQNPMHVWVRRYKKNKDIGLWNFDYGTSESYAQGRAFGERGTEDITPALSGQISGFITQWIDSGDKPEVDDMYDMFDTSQHLFETEISYAR
ncbi:MAG: pilus assembly protein TadG-related protein [Candidatus Omnitrophota bacterium]